MNILQRFLSNPPRILKTMLTGSMFPTLGGYRSNQQYVYGTAFACINVIASGISGGKLRLYRNTKKESVEVLNHPVVDLLRKPNQFQTGGDLKYVISSHLDIYGESYLWLRKEPKELWALDPSKMRLIKDSKKFLVGYIYNNGKTETKFDLTDIVPILRTNPFDQYSGISTIEKARMEIEADLSAIEFNQGFFKQGAMPSGLLTTETELSDGSFERLKDQWSSKYEGKDNAYKTLILEGGLKYQQLSLAQKDMDFINQRKFSRDQIISIFGVPKSVLAINDDVNRASAEVGKYVFADNTLKPRMQIISEKLTANLLPLMGLGAEYELLFDDPVPENKEAALLEKQASVNKWRTINEVRASEGLDKVENGDKLYVDATLIPLDEPMQPEQPTDNPNDKPSDDNTDDDNNDDDKNKSLGNLIIKSAKDTAYLRRRRYYCTRQERTMQNGLLQAFKDLTKKIKYSKASIGGDQLSVEIVMNEIMPETNTFTQTSTDLLMKYNTETLLTAVNQTNEAYNLGVTFNLENSGAIQWLKARSRKSAETMRDTVLNRARAVIAAQLSEDNFSLRKARNSIINTLADEDIWRVDRVARTETQTAYSKGAREVYEKSGMVKQTKWITAGDPCDICTQNNNHIVELNGVFPSGDSETPAHPNCRCEIIPYFGE